MLNKPLTRDDLETFFLIRKKKGSSDRRALNKVLRALGIRLRGGPTRWSVVLRALGLAETQDPSQWVELTAPLLTANDVAVLLGMADASIIYRWEKGALPANTPPFPATIDLSNGREDARAKRWRRAEVLAWHERRTPPKYVKVAPLFGTLIPNK
jgi:predicted DNA-binding transcriptional regulator AlpA